MRLVQRIRRPATIGIAVFLLAATPGIAAAQTDSDAPPSDRAPTDRAATDRRIDDRPERGADLDSVKERTLAGIDKRLEALERLSAKVDEEENVSANHAAHLQNDYREATRILEDGAEDVEDAETFEELREIVPGIFQETLVFALLKPKTHLVVGSDCMVAVYERMEEMGENLQAYIDRLDENGYEMGTAQAALDEMLRLLEAADDLAAPVADDVIGLDSGDWPDPAQGILEQGKADLAAARELLGEARGKAQETIEAIREALSS